MINPNCDLCGKEGLLYPQNTVETKKVTKMIEETYSIPDGKGGQKTETQKVPHKVDVPKTRKKRRLNAFTHKPEEYDAPVFKYHQEKIENVIMSVDDEFVQVELCQSCYKKHEKKIKDFMDFLFKMRGENA